MPEQSLVLRTGLYVIIGWCSPIVVQYHAALITDTYACTLKLYACLALLMH
jgi:hypothetical protein